MSEIAQGVDVDNLETTFSTLGPKYLKKTQKGESSPGLLVLLPSFVCVCVYVFVHVYVCVSTFHVSVCVCVRVVCV